MVVQSVYIVDKFNYFNPLTISTTHKLINF